ncbi:hypothetical protein C1H66_01235 [Halomonas heilongjiangensis]|uniref:Uncharacterized protein n=2 Tax=Halomonas heilongjiangensis TaxID=1387883 RepID=A0A2N7TU31_9GAMM|nr:hypothetical protein C1H66_01235 [Halomonas heilongjiangensis]
MDPTAPADPAAPGEAAPSDEPGFGDGGEPMPSPDAGAQSDPANDPMIEEENEEEEWENPAEDDEDSSW